MRNRAVVLIVVVAAVTACLAQFKSADKGPVPTFESQGYSLACTKLESHSKIDLAQMGEKKHTLTIEGRLTVRENTDIVAVTKALKVTRAADAEDTDLIKKDAAKEKSSKQYQKDTFAPVQDGKAEVEVKELQLTANAYKVKSMTVEAQAVIPRQRDNKRLPAIVMGEAQEFLPGLSVRIESLRMTAKRDLTLVIHYTRTAAGASGPFVEQAWILDEDGMKIGGARWSEGDPFGKTGSLTAKFKLAGGAAHKYVRLVAVTEYELKTIAFRIRGIFQQ